MKRAIIPILLLLGVALALAALAQGPGGGPAGGAGGGPAGGEPPVPAGGQGPSGGAGGGAAGGTAGGETSGGTAGGGAQPTPGSDRVYNVSLLGGVTVQEEGQQTSGVDTVGLLEYNIWAQLPEDLLSNFKNSDELVRIVVNNIETAAENIGSRTTANLDGTYWVTILENANAVLRPGNLPFGVGKTPEELRQINKATAFNAYYLWLQHAVRKFRRVAIQVKLQGEIKLVVGANLEIEESGSGIGVSGGLVGVEFHSLADLWNWLSGRSEQTETWTEEDNNRLKVIVRKMAEIDKELQEELRLTPAQAARVTTPLPPSQPAQPSREPRTVLQTPPIGQMRSYYDVNKYLNALQSDSRLIISVDDRNPNKQLLAALGQLELLISTNISLLWVDTFRFMLNDGKRQVQALKTTPVKTDKTLSRVSVREVRFPYKKFKELNLAKTSLQMLDAEGNTLAEFLNIFASNLAYYAKAGRNKYNRVPTHNETTATSPGTYSIGRISLGQDKKVKVLSLLGKNDGINFILSKNGKIIAATETVIANDNITDYILSSKKLSIKKGNYDLFANVTSNSDSDSNQQNAVVRIIIDYQNPPALARAGETISIVLTMAVRAVHDIFR